MRRDVKSLAVPVVAGEVDGQAAVGRLALDLAADVPERDAAVARAKLSDALKIVDGDAAVIRAQCELRAMGDVELELNRPVLPSISLGSGRSDVRGSFDMDAGHDAAGVGVGVGGPANDAADQHVAAVPADDLDAAVGAGIHVERRDAADGLFANLAEGRSPRIVPAGVVAAVRSSGIPEGLGVYRQTGR